MSLYSMDETLRAYADQHKKDTGHQTLIYGNFTECKTCGDHAHYAAYMEMIKHNADYSIHERIQLDK